MTLFLAIFNLVQLRIIFLTKHILFLIFGKNLDEASASSCLLLVAALVNRPNPVFSFRAVFN